MRKFFIAILISFTILPIVDASWRRTRPIYSFSRSEKVRHNRYTPFRWKQKRNPYRYRFSNKFKRTDRLLWRTMEPQGSSTEQIETPISKDFCNYHGSIIGEYLPSDEVTNRCCVCLDGWKCQYPVTAKGGKLECDPDWEPPDTTGDE
jgi:hypothetical protein